MQTIEVKGIKIYAYHGCLAEEERIGGNYIVDVRVDADVSNSFHSDKLSDTIDYVLLNKIVAQEMSRRSKLIEEVGYRIIQKIKASDERIAKAWIKVRKLMPPINGDVDEVSIELEI